jgi:hypothetical protein
MMRGRWRTVENTNSVMKRVATKRRYPVQPADEKGRTSREHCRERGTEWPLLPSEVALTTSPAREWALRKARSSTYRSTPLSSARLELDASPKSISTCSHDHTQEGSAKGRPPPGSRGAAWRSRLPRARGHCGSLQRPGSLRTCPGGQHKNVTPLCWSRTAPQRRKRAREEVGGGNQGLPAAAHSAPDMVQPKAGSDSSPLGRLVGPGCWTW